MDYGRVILQHIILAQSVALSIVSSGVPKCIYRGEDNSKQKKK